MFVTISFEALKSKVYYTIYIYIYIDSISIDIHPALMRCLNDLCRIHSSFRMFCIAFTVISYSFIENEVEFPGKLLRNYTQNVDGLEGRAGIQRVVQCHGSMEVSAVIIDRSRYESCCCDEPPATILCLRSSLFRHRSLFFLPFFSLSSIFIASRMSLISRSCMPLLDVYMYEM